LEVVTALLEISLEVIEFGFNLLEVIEPSLKLEPDIVKDNFVMSMLPGDIRLPEIPFASLSVVIVPSLICIPSIERLLILSELIAPGAILEVVTEDSAILNVSIELPCNFIPSIEPGAILSPVIDKPAILSPVIDDSIIFSPSIILSSSVTWRLLDIFIIYLTL
jgi:hypothetical protein